MRIDSVEIEGFRSFGLDPVLIRLPEIDVPVSIIGHNNSGKSNLLAAILHGTSTRPSYPNNFSEEDLFGRDPSVTAHINVRISPPLLSANAYNGITEMPSLRLRIQADSGVIDTSHYCYDADGRQVYNVRTVKRKGTKVYTAEEKEVLTSYSRTGAEQVHKWRSKIPLFYLGPETLFNELRPSRFSLLGRVIESFRAEFEDPGSVMPPDEGVVGSHVGRPRAKVYEQAMRYIEEHVLPAKGFKAFVDEVEAIVREQLDVDSDSFGVRFKPPEADSFFKNLRFHIREDEHHPLLPVERMGSGFVSLFVIALLRALVDTDEGGKIFLLEEPETYLHEHYQEYFYEVLCELAKTNQVIFTTHSKKFVNVFRPESIIRLRATPTGTVPVTSASAAVEFPGGPGGYGLKRPEDFPKFLRTLEPNLGNTVFSSRVVVVEGPHDLLAYRTALEGSIEWGLKNAAVVSAWGKDTVSALVQLCNAFEVPVFAIHDRDLPDDISDEADVESLSPEQKAHRTKNEKIAGLLPRDRVHQNRPNLEGVLGIPNAQKSAEAVFERLAGMSLTDVRATYPGLVPPALLDFLGIGTGSTGGDERDRGAEGDADGGSAPTDSGRSDI